MVVGAAVILLAGLIGLSLYSAGTGGPDLAGIPTTAGGVTQGEVFHTLGSTSAHVELVEYGLPSGLRKPLTAR